MSYWWLFLFVPLSYLIGNISFGIIISKHKLKRDVRTCGSGGAGATNMFRTFGKKWGYIVFFLDIFKGAIATMMGLLVFGTDITYSMNPMATIADTGGQIGMFACGFAAVLGHCFPFWAKFRGGKGMATAMGVFIVVNPVIGIAGVLLAFIYGTPFGYVSVASILSITFMVLWEGFAKNPGLVVSILLACFYVLVIIMHRKNIWRLLNECENQTRPFKKRSKPKQS